MPAAKFAQNLKTKKGSLSRELGIPLRFTIPQTLLNAIILSKIGETISNPTQLGKRRIKITKRLGDKAIFVKRMKVMKKKGMIKKINKSIIKSSRRNIFLRRRLRRVRNGVKMPDGRTRNKR